MTMTEKYLLRVSEDITTNGLYVNFDSYSIYNFGKDHTSDVKKYFSTAGKLCEFFEYSNPINSELKNIVIRILPNALDVVEVIGKEWLCKNLTNYHLNEFKNNRYSNASDDSTFILCVSKSFKQIVLLKQCYYNTKAFQSTSKIDGSSFQTDDIGYAILNSCFYHSDKYYKGIDWGTSSNKKSNIAIIGYPGEFYHKFMYSFPNNRLYITAFQTSYREAIETGIDYVKRFYEEKIHNLRNEIEMFETEKSLINSNISKISIECDLFGI